MVDESRDLEPDTETGVVPEVELEPEPGIMPEPDVEPVVEDEPEDDERHPLARVIVAVVLIIVIIIVFLLLRSCGSDDSSTSVTDGEASIVSVKGLPPQPGTVSVWVEQGADLDVILTAAAVRAGDVVNMGGGRFVVAVPAGTELSVVRRLSRADGVVDAGLVYASGAEK